MHMIQVIDHHTVYRNSAPGLRSRHGYFPGLIELPSGELIALFVLGEANFSDHGANRLGASALMQGLSDGYFVIPYTLGGYLAGSPLAEVNTSHPAFVDALAGIIDERANG